MDLVSMALGAVELPSGSVRGHAGRFPGGAADSASPRTAQCPMPPATDRLCREYHGHAAWLAGGAGPAALGELIVRGGMGAVYRVRDPELGRSLALKVLLDCQVLEEEVASDHHPHRMPRRRE